MSGLTKSEWLGDWYFVNGSWAVPEGTASNWRDILGAIKQKREHRERRVAVEFIDGGIRFYSPRNWVSRSDSVFIPTANIDIWVADAEKLLAETHQEVAP